MRARAVAGLVLLTGCSSFGPEPGAVLVAQEQVTACDPGACLTIEVTNQGPEPGGGSCTARPLGRDDRTTAPGGVVRVASLDPGESRSYRKVVRMTPEELAATVAWSSTCSPGPEG